MSKLKICYLFQRPNEIQMQIGFTFFSVDSLYFDKLAVSQNSVSRMYVVASISLPQPPSSISFFFKLHNLVPILFL